MVIDQRSLDIVAAPPPEGLRQGWPWPRDFYAAVVNYLFDSGARAVAFDMIFSETSIYTQQDLANDDKALAAATAGRPVVQSVMLTQEALEGSGLHADRAWPAGLLGDARVRRLKSAVIEPYNRATLPVEPLLGSAAALGWIGFEPDDDGTCRSILPTAVYSPAGSPDAIEVWSLPFALAGLMGARIDAPVGRPAARHLRVNGKRVPLDEERRLLLRFHGAEGTYRQFTFAAVLDAARRAKAGGPVEAARPGELPRQGRVRRRHRRRPARPALHLDAGGAARLHDPRHRARQHPARRRAAAAAVDVADGRAAAARHAGGALCGALPSLRANTPALLALLILYVSVALWLFAARRRLARAGAASTRAGRWATPASPATATSPRAATDDSSARPSRATWRRRSWISSCADPGRLALGGETRELTVMFADVAGFTSLSEGRQPHEIVELMNECFTALTDSDPGPRRHRRQVHRRRGHGVLERAASSRPTTPRAPAGPRATCWSRWSA